LLKPRTDPVVHRKMMGGVMDHVVTEITANQPRPDNERNPAEAADLGLWTRQYGVEFPMALDPLYQMGRYAPGDTAPLNLLLDAHDKMRILKKWTGNQESVIWPTIDTVLTARGKP